MDLLLHLLFLGAFVLLLAEMLPGVRVEGFGTALVVAIVYSLINVTLGTLLKIIGLPFIIITLGVFLVVINSFLLWLTDEILDDFEIDNAGTTFVAALLITFADTLLAWIF